MAVLLSIVKRDCKLFFKDKGMFFTSLITPVILLVLYATFLADVYKDIYASAIPAGLAINEKLLDGTVGAQLISSLLAVCCVTVAFCSNLLMVQDKISGARRDLAVTPVKPAALAVGYFLSSAAATLLIGLTALAVCLLYLSFVGWYMTAADVLLLVLDVVLLVLFGTALSSLVHFSLTTSGQASAVGTIVSAGYGFLCGAYMPISNFGEGLRNVLSFLPGTYGTCLLRNHAMRGVYAEMADIGFPPVVLEQMRDSVDCNLYFLGSRVEIDTMYLILGGSIAILIALYVLLHLIQKVRPSSRG